MKTYRTLVEHLPIKHENDYYFFIPAWEHRIAVKIDNLPSEVVEAIKAGNRFFHCQLYLGASNLDELLDVGFSEWEEG